MTGTPSGKVSTYTLHGTCAKAVTIIRIYDYEVLNPKWARWLCYYTRKQAIQMQILWDILATAWHALVTGFCTSTGGSPSAVLKDETLILATTW